MKIIKIFFLIFLFYSSNLFADNQNGFKEWKNDFKNLALKNNISEKTIKLFRYYSF